MTASEVQKIGIVDQKKKEGEGGGGRRGRGRDVQDDNNSRKESQ